MSLVRYVRGRHFLGATFGRRSGKVYARLYDKHLEAAADAPIREAWSSAGYDPAVHGQTVWRVEYELRGLRDFASSTGDRLPVNDPEALLRDHLGALWHYCAGSWLVLREEDGRSRRRRSAPTPWWQALAAHTSIDGQVGTLPTDLIRRPRIQPDTGRLFRQATGYLVSAAAANDTQSLEAMLYAFGVYARENIGEEAFARRVDDKIKERRGS